jgi:uncharacterized protein (DUF488 family)
MSTEFLPEFVTIGVYGFDAEQFFQALVAARVDTLCDIRRRRGVRGAEYAFANSQRLQERLAELGIRYLHYIDLAPSTALRKQQEAADKQGHTARRKRALLSPQFVQGYEQSVLADFDAAAFVASLGPDARVAALLCVEREPAACHRSLLAAHLHAKLGVSVRHVTPPGNSASSTNGV